MAIAFTGFSKETFTFFRGLAENNNRAWFHSHYEEYQEFLVRPAQEFVIALGRLLRRLSSDIHAEPRIGGSIMRINRDIRFSRDKRPYKDHLDLWFWQGEGPSRELPGYWFRLTTRQLILGAGIHMLEPPLLDRYRRAVADDGSGKRLQRIVRALAAERDVEVGGQRYKRVPAGYDPHHERADLLRHNGLYAGVTLEPLPSPVHRPDFPEFCFGQFKRFAAIPNWLTKFLVSEPA